MSSGLEILAGHPKDLPLGTFRPGPASLLDLNPAFRLPSSIPGLPGYPGHSPGPGGAVCRDPYCKDPSCPTFVYNAYMASARMRLPPGYLELLEAHKQRVEHHIHQHRLHDHEHVLRLFSEVDQQQQSGR